MESFDWKGSGRRLPENYGNKNALNSVESRLLEDKFCCLLLLLWYQSCNYVRMYSKRKNCKERQVAHPSFTPVWNLWKPFTYRYCSSEENLFRDFTLKKLNDGFYQHNFHSCLASAFISPYSWCWRDLRVQCLELCTACMLS